MPNDSALPTGKWEEEPGLLHGLKLHPPPPPKKVSVQDRKSQNDTTVYKEVGRELLKGISIYR